MGRPQESPNVVQAVALRGVGTYPGVGACLPGNIQYTHVHVCDRVWEN